MMTHYFYQGSWWEKVLVLLLGSMKKHVSNSQQRDRQKESVSVRVLHTVKLLVQRCSLEHTCVQWYCYVINDCAAHTARLQEGYSTRT